MSVRSFERIVRTENLARRYLVGLCWPGGQRFCPRCGSKEVYKYKGIKLRCKRCRYDFHSFTDRWINQLRITSRQWLWIVKLFELELSTRKISQQVELSYPTTLKATTVLRRAILAAGTNDQELLRGEVEMDEAYFGGHRKGKRGRGAAGKVPVFGILERDGVVTVEVVRDVTADTLLTQTLKKVRRGSIVYTDRYQGYDSLMFCGYRHLSINHKKLFASGKVYINGIEGFWSYAKERLIKHHGLSKHRFPLYLKEMEFRYNHRHQELFPLLTQFLVKPGGVLL